MTDAIDLENAKHIENARRNISLVMVFRQRSNVSELSVEAGLNKNTLGNFLNGTSRINYSNLLKVCRILECPIGILHLDQDVTRDRLELHKSLLNLDDTQLRATLGMIRAMSGS